VVEVVELRGCILTIVDNNKYRMILSRLRKLKVNHKILGGGGAWIILLKIEKGVNVGLSIWRAAASTRMFFKKSRGMIRAKGNDACGLVG
jgi:hypothetical protein